MHLDRAFLHVVAGLVGLTVASVHAGAAFAEAGPALEGVKACGGSARLHEGAVELAAPLSVDDLTDGAERLGEVMRCVDHIGTLLVAHPLLADLTVITRFSGDRAASDQALAAVERVGRALVQAGVPVQRVTAVVKATEGAPDAVPGRIDIAWREKGRITPAGQLFAGSGPLWLVSQNGLRTDAPSFAVLMTGQALETGTGSVARALLFDGTTLRLGSDTRVEFLEARGGAERRIRLAVARGEVHVVRGKEGGYFEVKTPNGRVVIEGHAGRIAILEGPITRVDAFEGTTLLGGSGGDVFVGPGKTARVDFRGVPENPTALLVRPAPIEPLYGPMRAGELLAWDPVPEATGYRVELARDAAFSDKWFSYEVQATRMPLPDVFSGGRWYWRVSALDERGNTGLPSRVFGFDT
jgi:ferric-dicitrate binding protein FerR (iron transport regulator)